MAPPVIFAAGALFVQKDWQWEKAGMAFLRPWGEGGRQWEKAGMAFCKALG
jgi:hypothetical protein